jgi:hypothetical protein
MCWNKKVSINTFLFTSFILFIIWISKHKPYQFNNNYLYIFILSFTFMQLVEYFIWTSIETRNHRLNQISSFFGWTLIRIIQPISALLLLPDAYSDLRAFLLPAYIVSLVGTTIYKSLYNPIQFKTIVNKNGHLDWLWNKLSGYEIINVIMYFVCITTLFIRYPFGFTVSILLLLVNVFYYKNTWGSNWCYASNLVLLYYFLVWIYLQYTH